MTSEKRILNESLIAVSALPLTIAWRNNTGQAWQGSTVRVYPGTNIPVPPGVVVLVNARPFKAGTLGSPDIVGVCRGRGFGIETKTASGRQSEQQQKFESAFTRCGGLYGVARSAQEAVTILTGGGGDGGT